MCPLALSLRFQSLLLGQEHEGAGQVWEALSVLSALNINNQHYTHISYIYSCNKLRASLKSSSLNIFNSWHLETMDLLTCRYPWPSSLAGVYGPANQQADLCHPGPSKPFKVVKSQTRTICPVPKVPKVLQVDGFNGFNGGVVKIWPAFGGVAFAPAASACWVRLWAFGAQRTASAREVMIWMLWLS
jgi:hypothetical protein